MTGALMSLTAGVCGLVAFLLSMPVTLAHRGWGVSYSPAQICALKGSTVVITSVYRFPSAKFPTTTVERTMWLREKYGQRVDLETDSRYFGRTQYICGNNNNCTLMIRDVSVSDSAKYQFRFTTNKKAESYTGLPGVTLTVAELWVSASHRSYSLAELKCHSSCRLSDDSVYIWYKNGQKVEEGPLSYSANENTRDSYSCALKGREDVPSYSACVIGDDCNTVWYTDRSICAFRGSSVDISCTYKSYYGLTSKLWFIPERGLQWQSPSRPEDSTADSQYAGRVQVLEPWSGRSTLRITDLRKSDSAQYRFRFTAGSFEWGSSLPGTTLTVTDPDLQVLVVHRSSERSVWRVLTCQSSCLSGASSYSMPVTWYRNGEVILRSLRKTYSVSHDAENSYSCALSGHEAFPSPSVCAVGRSCNRVTYADRSICAPKGSSVDISCTYNSYIKYVTSKLWLIPESGLQWLSEDPTDSQYGGRVQVLDPGSGLSTLRITDLRESDSAQYRFRFTARRFEWRSSLPGTTLTVTALKVQVSRVTVQQDYTYAELRCHTSCGSADHPTYVWFKNGKNIMEGESSYEGQIDPGDGFCCALKGHETYRSPSVYAVKVPSVTVTGEIVEGSSVTLTCSSDANPAAKYTWYKKNGNLNPVRTGPQLVFSSIQSSDSGQYYCRAENDLGWRESEHIFLDVHYAPKMTSASKTPSGEIVEGSSVTLTCSSDANPAAKYTWYKENLTLIEGSDGGYHFTSISSVDRGTYCCKSVNEHGQLHSKIVFIDVQYGPRSPSVSMSPSGGIVEGSSVTLTCSSDAKPAAKYTWYKENEDSPKASGQNFTITDFRAEHSGNYYCEVQNKRGSYNSTLLLVVVAGSWKSTASGLTTATVLAAIIVFVFILMRKKKAYREPQQSGERADNREQEDLHYASVRFFKNHTDALYCNVRSAQPLRPKEEEEEEEKEDEGIEYTAVVIKGGSAGLRSQRSDREDSAALYSTINKTH